MRILLLGLSVLCFVIALASLVFLLSIVCWAVALPSLEALDEVLALAILALAIVTELGVQLFSLSRKYEARPMAPARGGRVLLYVFSLTSLFAASLRLPELNRNMSLEGILALLIPLVLAVRLFSLARQYRDEPTKAVRGILGLAYAVAVIVLLSAAAVIAYPIFRTFAIEPKALGQGAALAVAGVFVFVVVWRHDRAVTQQAAK